MNMKIEYLPLEKHLYFNYFTDPVIFVPEEDRKMIKPLSEQSAKEVWNHLISSRNRHPMLLDKNDWLSQIDWVELDQWQNDWNENKYDKINNTLREKVDWTLDTPVYFCWGQENIFETTWGVFTRYWINFLFDDEGPILIAEGKNEVFSFGPQGGVYFGIKRKG